MSNIVTEPSQLAKVIGKGKSTIACCQNCGLSQLRVKWCPNEQYFWAINVSCLLCSNKWTICNVIDRTYVRGKYAILQNLPHPSVIKVKDHSYVSLVDIVAHVLAFSTNIRCVSQGDVNALSEDGQVTVITTSPVVG
jgi:hypothetical protein